MVIIKKWAREVLEAIGEPKTAAQVADELGISKQLALYRLKALEKHSLAKVAYLDVEKNLVARHFVRTKNRICVEFGEAGEEWKKEVSATIILGSPSPHGEEMSHARDMIAAALVGQSFPGSKVIYDVLLGPHNGYGVVVVVGGPIANTAYKRFGFPAFSGRSFKAGRKFSSPFHGLVSSRPNPYDPAGRAIAIAGNTSHGTIAAALAVRNAEIFNHATSTYVDIVVKGQDNDNDGIVDSFGVVHESERRVG